VVLKFGNGHNNIHINQFITITQKKLVCQCFSAFYKICYNPSPSTSSHKRIFNLFPDPSPVVDTPIPRNGFDDIFSDNDADVFIPNPDSVSDGALRRMVLKSQAARVFHVHDTWGYANTLVPVNRILRVNLNLNTPDVFAKITGI